MTVSLRTAVIFTHTVRHTHRQFDLQTRGTRENRRTHIVFTYRRRRRRRRKWYSNLICLFILKLYSIIGLFMFKDTKEGPRAPAVKSGRVTKA